MAVRTAEIMAGELNYDQTWQTGQVKKFQELAQTYSVQVDTKGY